MPITPTGLQGAILGGLTGSGMLGVATPKLATGLAVGLMQWIPTVQVLTVDTGTAGVGVGVAILVMPPPLWQSALQTGFAMAGILGPMAPAMVTGLANGLSVGFGQGLVSTRHPSVGAGAGVAKFIPPPSLPSLQAGLSGQTVGGVGGSKIALAVSFALTTVFSAFTIPVAIAGPPSTSPSAGVGSGSIV